MGPRELRRRIEAHLQVLAGGIGARPPGSPANQRAAEHVRTVLADAGLAVRDYPFETSWWEPGEGMLTGSGFAIEVTPNPYSRPCDVEGVVTRVGSLGQLAGRAPAPGRILVIDGELAHEPLVPRAFPFLAAPHHRRIIAALQAAQPLAVVAVSDHGEPILEDPDVPLASVTIPTATGRLLREGELVRLQLGGQVHQGVGVTVAARTAGGGPRALVSAHLDSKATTPGAFDDASGMAVLLALAEWLPPMVRPIELVAFNGEDHFDACGEQAWLVATDLSEIAIDINIDGVGWAGRPTTLAPVACPVELEAQVQRFALRHATWDKAPPTYAGDHAIFAAQGIPAIAVTSAGADELIGSVLHGPSDTLDRLDLDILAEVVVVIRELLLDLDREGPLAHLELA